MFWKSTPIALVAFLIGACAGVPRNKADEPQRSLTEPEARAWSAADSWLSERPLNAVVAVGHQGNVFATKAAGTADFSTERELTAKTVFQLGSISKYVLSTAVFALVQQGRLDLDRPISSYLPWYRSDTGSQISLAHLLTNSSGLPAQATPIVTSIPKQLKDNPGSSISDLGYDDITLREGIVRYASGDLKFAPGTQFDYINENWMLVTAIVRSVRDESLQSALSHYVFEPLQMNCSGTFEPDLTETTPPRPDVAIGYNPEGKNHDGDYPLPAFVGGGIYSCAEDLVKLMHGIHSTRLFDSQLLERFLTQQFEEKHYAFGGSIREVEISGGQRRLSVQTGSNGASKSTILHDLETGLTIVALANDGESQGAMLEMSQRVLEAWLASPGS